MSLSITVLLQIIVLIYKLAIYYILFLDGLSSSITNV